MLLGKAQRGCVQAAAQRKTPQVTGEEASAGTVSIWLLGTLVPFSGIVSKAGVPSTSSRTLRKEKGDGEPQPPQSTPFSFHLQELAPPHNWDPQSSNQGGAGQAGEDHSSLQRV